MINFLQRDYEYLQSFLSTNIGDPDIVILLNKSTSIKQIATIIELLRKGDKNGSHLSSMKMNYSFKMSEKLVRQSFRSDRNQTHEFTFCIINQSYN
jgi:hypothetical protein